MFIFNLATIKLIKCKLLPVSPYRKKWRKEGNISQRWKAKKKCWGMKEWWGIKERWEMARSNGTMRNEGMVRNDGAMEWRIGEK